MAMKLGLGAERGGDVKKVPACTSTHPRWSGGRTIPTHNRTIRAHELAGAFLINCSIDCCKLLVWLAPAVALQSSLGEPHLPAPPRPRDCVPYTMSGTVERNMSVDDLVGGMWRMGAAAGVGFKRTDSEAAFQEFLKRIPSSTNITQGGIDASLGQHLVDGCIPGMPRVPSVDFLRQLANAQSQMGGVSPVMQGARVNVEGPAAGAASTQASASESIGRAVGGTLGGLVQGRRARGGIRRVGFCRGDAADVHPNATLAPNAHNARARPLRASTPTPHTRSDQADELAQPGGPEARCQRAIIGVAELTGRQVGGGAARPRSNKGRPGHQPWAQWWPRQRSTERADVGAIFAGRFRPRRRQGGQPTCAEVSGAHYHRLLAAWGSKHQWDVVKPRISTALKEKEAGAPGASGGTVLAVGYERAAPV
eukprot:365630-Chlamydomonas_euryale.AAC.12